jgi:hypothetical protein
MFAMEARRHTGPKRPRGVTREAVRELPDSGLVVRDIATRLGISKGTVAFHMRNLHLAPDERFGRRYDWTEIRGAYDSGLSFRECRARFGFSQKPWYDAVERGAIIPRPTARPIEELLVSGPPRNRFHLKARLIKAGLKENRCERCGINEWQEKPLAMQLHHINGEGLDNRLENLELLCANCHSQTETYGGRNGHRRKRSAGELTEEAEPEAA